MHFVLPAAPVSGLTMLLIVLAAAEPGPLRFTKVRPLEDELHILLVGKYGEGGFG
jgi:hypothetical protein